MNTLKAELLYKADARLGEGPVWNEEEKRLYWVDIIPGELHRFDPRTGKDESFSCGEQIGTFAFRKNGGFVAAMQSGIYNLDLSESEVKKKLVVDPEPDTPNRFNDGKCDPAGRFLAGTIYTDRKDGSRCYGGFYSVEPDGGFRKLLNNITISNGLCFSPNYKTFYYIDSTTQKVDAYDYDLKTGSLSNGRTAVQIPKEAGLPDGMTIDAEGMLWIALYGGSAVIRINPESGEILTKVEVPAIFVTCPTFGGEDFSTLYITTRRKEDASEENDPLGGALFVVQPGVAGMPSFRFGK